MSLYLNIDIQLDLIYHYRNVKYCKLYGALAIDQIPIEIGSENALKLIFILSNTVQNYHCTEDFFLLYNVFFEFVLVGNLFENEEIGKSDVYLNVGQCAIIFASFIPNKYSVLFLS